MVLALAEYGFGRALLVVSKIPGLYLFRIASGLVHLAGGSTTTLDLLSATISDGITAITIILAMSAGLFVPKLAIARFENAHTRSTSSAKRG